MKTALYVRTSTSRQGKGLEAQLRALRQYCKDEGSSSYKVYSDSSVSGTKKDRAALNSLLRDCENGDIDRVLVYSFSRFARSTKFLLETLELFNSLDIVFISLTEKIDTASPTGKALFSIISAMAQLERDLVSERVRNGLDNARSNGKVLGRPKTIKKAVIEALRKRGLSYREIARITQCSISSVSRHLA